ncbi:hypothetical protein COBT_003830 [Conglomerata obtusa]
MKNKNYYKNIDPLSIFSNSPSLTITHLPSFYHLPVYNLGAEPLNLRTYLCQHQRKYTLNDKKNKTRTTKTIKPKTLSARGATVNRNIRNTHGTLSARGATSKRSTADKPETLSARGATSRKMITQTNKIHKFLDLTKNNSIDNISALKSRTRKVFDCNNKENFNMYKNQYKIIEKTNSERNLQQIEEENSIKNTNTQFTKELTKKYKNELEEMNIKYFKQQGQHNWCFDNISNNRKSQANTDMNFIYINKINTNPIENNEKKLQINEKYNLTRFGNERQENIKDFIRQFNNLLRFNFGYNENNLHYVA